MTAFPLNHFSRIVQEMGAVGMQMTHIDAAEGSAGNLSVYVQQLLALDPGFVDRGLIDLPALAPALAGGWLVITGAGRRLRDAGVLPEKALCVLQVEPGGQCARLFAAQDPDSGQVVQPTSELNSHLAIHNDQVGQHRLDYHALVHAQPPYITYLSHIGDYANTHDLNDRLMRWEPETILTFPEGIGMIPFQVPGSAEQMSATLEGLRHHRVVVWQRHGVVVRSAQGIQKAADWVEYVETAARYEYLNLQADEPASGLSDEELRRICAAFNIEQPYF